MLAAADALDAGTDPSLVTRWLRESAPPADAPRVLPGGGGYRAAW